MARRKRITMQREAQMATLRIVPAARPSGAVVHGLIAELRAILASVDAEGLRAVLDAARRIGKRRG